MSKEVCKKEFDKILQLIDKVDYRFKEKYKSKKTVNNMVEHFVDNKGRFFEYFDDDLRLRIDINPDDVELSESDIRMVFQNWNDEKAPRLFHNNEQYKDNLRGWKKIYEFVKDIFLKDLNPQDIITGKLQTSIINPNNEEILNENTKVSKFLIGKFEACEEDLFDNKSIAYYDIENKPLVKRLMLDYYSQLLSSLKTKTGTVVLSINPLDYMLTSASTNGWRSCHNFVDGNSRLAGLSLANDYITMIAYAYEDFHQFKYKGYKQKLPKKLWRQMLYIDEHEMSAVFVKEYPEPNPVFSKYARKFVGRLLADMNDKESAWYFKNINSGITQDSLGKDEDIEDIRVPIDIETAQNMHHQDNIVSAIRLKDRSALYPMTIKPGEKIVCPICGKLGGYEVHGSYNYVCNDCRGKLKSCIVCGDIHHKELDNVYQDKDEDIYCEECYQEKLKICEVCGTKNIEYDMQYFDNNYFCRHTDCKKQYIENHPDINEEAEENTTISYSEIDEASMLLWEAV